MHMNQQQPANHRAHFGAGPPSGGRICHVLPQVVAITHDYPAAGADKATNRWLAGSPVTK